MTPEMPTALYPGSFDPFHNGHLDVVSVAAELFGSVIVAVLVNPQKPAAMFEQQERTELIEASVAHLPGVVVRHFTGLVVDAVGRLGADFIVKGLRTVGDFEIEQQMAHTNHAVSGVRTVYVPASPAQSFVASSFIRDITRYGGDVSALVPPPVAARLQERFPR
ncbi:MAG: pantetheine-phosphate adenylyltransferase [Acidimicrobiales bacterium]